jgi:hypothetical protein
VEDYQSWKNVEVQDLDGRASCALMYQESNARFNMVISDFALGRHAYFGVFTQKYTPRKSVHEALPTS